MLFFYLRHGDPIYSPDSLTPLGERQAEALGKRLAQYGIDQIYASTSQRAIQTAMYTSRLVGKPIVQLDFCNESHAWEEFTLPDSNGKRFWAVNHDWVRRSFLSPEIRQMGNRWYEHPMYREYPFKAGMERISRETDAFLLSLGYRHDRERGLYEVVRPNDDRVALFAHEGFGACFLSSLLDIPYPQFVTHFAMTHTAMTVIDFSEQDGVVIPKVLTFANEGHLYRENVPKNCSSRTRY